MSEYNGSTLTKEQWEEAEALCAENFILKTILADYKKLHRGAVKRAIQTYDNYLTFTDAALDFVCGGNSEGIADDEDFLSVGDDSEEAIIRFKVSRFLKDKDDKTAERLAVMLKNYKSHLTEREQLLNDLGADDQAEVKAPSRWGHLAKEHESKLKA